MFFLLGSISQLLAAFRSRSLDVYECERETVEERRLPDRAGWTDLASPRPAMAITGWKLAHAVVQADFLVSGDHGFASVGFLFQMDRILDLASSGNLRLFAGAARSLNDVTQSSVVGRVGQGLSILFAHDRGFRFACHLAQLPEVAAWLATNPTAENRRVADFLFEGAGFDRMILESKATFALDANDPVVVKASLKAALTKQVTPWMTRITPHATKGFGVFSAVREHGGAPSMITFVDPEADGESGKDVAKDATVRRWNYAAWLSAMGLNAAAERLRRRQTPEPVPAAEVDVFVAAMAGRKFAVIAAYEPGVVMPARTRDPLELLRTVGHIDANPHKTFVAMGIELQAMRAIEQAIGGDDRALLAYDTESERPDDVDRSRSIFPDGSFFGLVKAEDIRDVETFLL